MKNHQGSQCSAGSGRGGPLWKDHPSSLSTLTPLLITHSHPSHSSIMHCLVALWISRPFPQLAEMALQRQCTCCNPQTHSTHLASGKVEAQGLTEDHPTGLEKEQVTDENLGPGTSFWSLFPCNCTGQSQGPPPTGRYFRGSCSCQALKWVAVD